ncbi:hypothetical protein Agabi119p4_2340 [Agaricus bisporus var. burnettii]|uniref:Uncharacterized protein n=1 Tax=Agaricus bisporus var. burnettii TaxID=192524 RepID=A0A8H7F9A1_AGABI|nr:hypothetical protein Agabi119p4_2340 [Agaricus bisporus var. burnettii]
MSMKREQGKAVSGQPQVKAFEKHEEEEIGWVSRKKEYGRPIDDRLDNGMIYRIDSRLAVAQSIVPHILPSVHRSCNIRGGKSSTTEVGLGDIASSSSALSSL